jgi:endonuclease-3
VRALLAGLDELYPEADCELVHRNAFELLVATILSAQCTDKVVNTVTPALFARYPDAAALAAADPSEVEQLVAKTGFFRQKTKSIIGAAAILAREHGGEVPRDMEALRQLPGVARKTANVVLGTAYGIPSGVVVDTHIARLSGRLGLSREEDPVKIEQDLMRVIPQDRWIKFGHQLIWHGRRVCAARKPRCGECLLAPHCPSAFQV